MSQRVLQLTDCHLPAEAGTLFRGEDADARLAALVELLRKQPPFDTLLLTGDLVHHGGPDAYRRLLTLVRPLGCEVHWLPGNHDEPVAMHATDPDGKLGLKRIDLAYWTLLLLDSTANPDGRGSGELAPAELDWLQHTLSELEDRSVLLALHHNPAATGSLWQDAIRLGNPEALAAVLVPCPQVRALICGHLHQSQALQFAGRPLWCAPSTAVQFAAGCETFTLETQAALSTPGCRWYELHDDGRINAHLLYLPAESEESVVHV